MQWPVGRPTTADVPGVGGHVQRGPTEQTSMGRFIHANRDDIVPMWAATCNVALRDRSPQRG